VPGSRSQRPTAVTKLRVHAPLELSVHRDAGSPSDLSRASSTLTYWIVKQKLSQRTSRQIGYTASQSKCRRQEGDGRHARATRRRYNTPENPTRPPRRGVEGRKGARARPATRHSGGDGRKRPYPSHAPGRARPGWPGLARRHRRSSIYTRSRTLM
jgi:hypothetical protein